MWRTLYIRGNVTDHVSPSEKEQCKVRRKSFQVISCTMDWTKGVDLMEGWPEKRTAFKIPVESRLLEKSLSFYNY